jgi:signal transduction histidine kinase
MARGALSALRHDLIDDAFAFNPLPPMRIDRPALRRAPERTRAALRWLPHGAIVFLAVILALIAADESDRFGLELPLAALAAGIPLLMTLFRPIGAWWLSVAAGLVGGLFLASSTDVWPWTAAGFVAHVTVMMLVTLRSRPRVALEMWLITTVIEIGAQRTSDAFATIVLSGLALLVAVAIRGWRDAEKQVVQQESITAVERSRRTLLEERTTIARELHDVVAHHMSVIAIQAEAAPYRVENPPPELAQAFATIRENAVIALTELRRVLGVVRAEGRGADDDPEAPQPTLAMLDSLLGRVREAGLTVEKVVTGAVRPLPQGIELSAYRIVQEALSNVLRHAPGADTRAEVSYVPVGLGLRVVNGPPTGAVPPSPGAGHGLLGMRERAAMLGGELTTRPTDDGGYEVTAFFPVDPEEPVDAAANKAGGAA